MLRRLPIRGKNLQLATDNGDLGAAVRASSLNGSPLVLGFDLLGAFDVLLRLALNTIALHRSLLLPRWR